MGDESEACTLSFVSTTRHSELVAPFDAVVVVGSHGALCSFERMLDYLPASFPAAVVFDLHRADRDGVTERLLRRRAAMPVHLAREGLALERGHLYLAPADRQLVITAECGFSLLEPAQGTGHASANSLLESAARILGPRLIAIVLSGRLDGGARGARAVKQHGGRVIVEDPSGAVAASMPNAALASGCVDFALAPERIGDAVLALCSAVGAADLFRVRLNAGVAC